MTREPLFISIDPFKMNTAAYRGYQVTITKERAKSVFPVLGLTEKPAMLTVVVPIGCLGHSFQRHPHWEWCPCGTAHPSPDAAHYVRGTVPKYFPSIHTANPRWCQHHPMHSTERESSSQRSSCLHHTDDFSWSLILRLGLTGAKGIAFPGKCWHS